MCTIETTQYIRPNGQPVKRKFEIPAEYKEPYEAILAAGCHLTCEQLMNGVAVHYITYEEEGDFDIQMSKANDEEDANKVLLAQIKAFDPAKFHDWLDAVRCI